tara:strand:+ start:408 stop:872 length:465 start_codon:yes stop_codon:yes gene_type:complete
MGGSAKQVVKKVAKETGYTGSDLDKGAQAVGSKGSEAIEYTKKKGSEVVEGVKEHGSAIATATTAAIGGIEDTLKRSDIGRKAAEFQDYLKERFGMGDKDKDEEKRRAKPQTQGPGGQQTVGQGGVEGLKGGGQMAQGQRSRIRQNKRKLRIAK